MLSITPLSLEMSDTGITGFVRIDTDDRAAILMATPVVKLIGAICYPSTSLMNGVSQMTHMDATHQGDVYMNQGDTEQAIEAYAAAHNGEELVALGDLFLGRGQLEIGLKAYSRAGFRPPYQKVIACGDRCFEEERFPDALQAYRIAGAQNRVKLCRQIADSRAVVSDILQQDSQT